MNIYLVLEISPITKKDAAKILSGVAYFFGITVHSIIYLVREYLLYFKESETPHGTFYFPLILSSLQLLTLLIFFRNDTLRELLSRNLEDAALLRISKIHLAKNDQTNEFNRIRSLAIDGYYTYCTLLQWKFLFNIIQTIFFMFIESSSEFNMIKTHGRDGLSASGYKELIAIFIFANVPRILFAPIVINCKVFITIVVSIEKLMFGKEPFNLAKSSLSAHGSIYRIFFLAKNPLRTIFSRVSMATYQHESRQLASYTLKNDDSSRVP